MFGWETNETIVLEKKKAYRDLSIPIILDVNSTPDFAKLQNLINIVRISFVAQRAKHYKGILKNIISTQFKNISISWYHSIDWIENRREKRVYPLAYISIIYGSGGTASQTFQHTKKKILFPVFFKIPQKRPLSHSPPPPPTHTYTYSIQMFVCTLFHLGYKQFSSSRYVMIITAAIFSLSVTRSIAGLTLSRSVFGHAPFLVPLNHFQHLRGHPVRWLDKIKIRYRHIHVVGILAYVGL